MTAVTPPPSTYICPWCRTQSASDGSSCPACGAPVDVSLRVSRSGWYEMPAVKDMAQIHFGRSRLQIAGSYVPSADFALAGGEGIQFPHHQLLWMENGIQIQNITPPNSWNRVRAGLPVHLIAATGPGRLAISRDKPGEVVAIPIQPMQAVDVKEHVFLAASLSAAFTPVPTHIWFQTGSGDDARIHRPLGQFLDRFQAGPEPALAVVHAGGNVFMRGLAMGEVIDIRPTSLLFKDPSVRISLHLEYPNGFERVFGWGMRTVWLRCHGPGRLAMQSGYDECEDPRERITNTCGATQRHW